MPSRFDQTPVDLDDPDPWQGDMSWAIPSVATTASSHRRGAGPADVPHPEDSFRKRAMAAREPCWLCGNLIDYAAKSGRAPGSAITSSR